MASTVKLTIAAAYLAEVDRSRRSIDDVVTGRSVATLMELLIVNSDNRAADHLLRTLGGPAGVQQWLSAKEITGIRVDRPIAQLLREHGHLADSREVATPNAIVMLLNNLNNGAVPAAQDRAFLLDLMSRCETGTCRIRVLLPAGTAVENKTGISDCAPFLERGFGNRCSGRSSWYPRGSLKRKSPVVLLAGLSQDVGCGDRI